MNWWTRNECEWSSWSICFPNSMDSNAKVWWEVITSSELVANNVDCFAWKQQHRSTMHHYLWYFRLYRYGSFHDHLLWSTCLVFSAFQCILTKKTPNFRKIRKKFMDKKGKNKYRNKIRLYTHQFHSAEWNNYGLRPKYLHCVFASLALLVSIVLSSRSSIHHW